MRKNPGGKLKRRTEGRGTQRRGGRKKEFLGYFELDII